MSIVNRAIHATFYLKLLKVLISLITINALLLVEIPAFGSNNRYSFEYFHQKRLSSKDTVYSILKDKKGSIWLGTSKGLLRDSNQIDISPDGTSSLLTPTVSTLYQDESDDLWIGTDKGLCQYHNASKQLIWIDTFNQLINNEVIFYKIIESPKKDLFLVTSKGVFILQKQGFAREYSVGTVNLDDARQVLFFDNTTFLDLFFLLDNTLLIGTNKGLFHVQEQANNQFKLLKYIKNFGTNESTISTLFVDDTNLIWLGSPTGLHFLRINHTANGYIYNLEEKPSFFPTSSPIQTAAISSFLLTKEKQVLIGTTSNGLFSFNQENGNIEHHELEDKLVNQLNKVGIIDMVLGQSDDIWLATTSGLIKAKNTPPTFIKASILFYLLSFLGVSSIGCFFYINNNDSYSNKEISFNKEDINKINAAKLKIFIDIDNEFDAPLNLIINPSRDDSNLKNIPMNLKDLVNNIEVRERQITNLKETDFSDSKIPIQPLSVVHNDLGAFVQKVVKRFQAYTLKKEIEIETIIPTNALLAWYDPMIIERVLISLLTTMSNYAENGDQIVIKMALKENDLAILEFFHKDQTSDIKFTKEQSTESFKEFFPKLFKRKDLTKKDLNLYLSKKLIHLPKGAIELYSEVSSQNRFELLLPIGKAHYELSSIELENKIKVTTTPLSSKKEELSPSTTQTNNLNKNTLLIVDDSSEIRQFISEIFDVEFHILEAENGAIGYDLAVEHIPDIIISDVMMPEMTGFELAAKLKNDHRINHIPLILLTALNDFESQKTGFEEGGDVYISKPFSPQLLKLQVNNLISTKRKNTAYNKEKSVLEPTINPVDNVDIEFLKTINEFLEINYAFTELNVHALAQESYMSYIQFYRKFKTLTGINAKEYIRTFRLKKAANFLKADAEGSVSEVMHKVGFSGQSYFSASFKKQFGVTPSEFKARNNEA